MTPRTIWRLFKIGRRVKKWVETAYTKELERVLVETQGNLVALDLYMEDAQIKDPTARQQVVGIIAKLDETVESLKVKKLDPFEMSQGE